MCDNMQTSNLDGRMAVPLDFLEDVDDFGSLLEDVQGGEINTRKRLRSEGEDGLESLVNDAFEIDDHLKKAKITDVGVMLMNAELKDDAFTSSCVLDCPSLMDSIDVECDDLDMDVSTLFTEDDANNTREGMYTPPPVLSRSSSLATPPLSPRSSDDGALELVRGTSCLSVLSSRTLSGISVLSDDILDLDTIPVTLEDSALATPAPKSRAQPLLYRPTRKVEVEGGIPMPPEAWLDKSSPPSCGPVAAKLLSTRELPAIKVKRVYVEEQVLSTAQREKHRRWVVRRKKCLTGFTGYRCPAKSRAAKRKKRNNGRFDLKET